MYIQVLVPVRVARELEVMRQMWLMKQRADQFSAIPSYRVDGCVINAFRR